MLKIEQPARLNKYVDQTIPITWETRWSAMKLSLPLMLFCSFLFIEMAALRWFLGKPVRFDVAAIAAFTFPLLPLIAAEIQLRVAHQTKRVLKIDDTGVSTSIRGSSVKWRWPTVQAFEICPIAEEPTLRKVVIYSSRNSPKGSFQLQRALVLPDAKALEDLRNLLQHKSDFEGALYELRDGKAIPEIKRRPRLAAVVYLALSFFLFIHGFPLIMVGLGVKHQRDPIGEVQPQGPHPLDKALAKAAPWAKRHFKDANELTRAMRTVALALGITCTTAAVLIWRTGTKLPPQESVIQSTVAKI